MNISFDLDDTLFLHPNSSENGTAMFHGEYLRFGALDLMKELQKDHSLWLYTTSDRGALKLKLSFFVEGIKIRKVINQSIHLKKMKGLNLTNFPTKHPKVFGIDLHIDDSKGVVIEGDRFGFRAIAIDPDDEQWTEIVKAEVNRTNL